MIPERLFPAESIRFSLSARIHLPLFRGSVALALTFLGSGLLHGQNVTAGLAAYYPLNGDAVDVSGRGFNGTVVNAAPTNDRFGTTNAAFQFGSNTWIQLPDEILPVAPSEISISVWVRPDAGPFNTQQEIIDFTTRRGEFGLSILPGISGGPAQFDFGAHLQASGWQTIDTPVVTNAWSHLLATFKQGESIQFWLNGRLVKSNSIPNEPLFLLPTYALNTALGIYDWAPGPYYPFAGALDDLRIYSRAISAAEVQQIYEFESATRPKVSLIKAVKPSFQLLAPGTNYQLQVSMDSFNWTNHGQPFTATNSSFISPEYFDVDQFNQLYFRLQVTP